MKCDIHKTLLLVFNFTFFILAIFTLTLCAALLTKNNNIDARLFSHCTFGVVNGAILLGLSFFGSYAIIKNKIGLLKMFVFAASIMTIIHLMLAIMGFATAYKMDYHRTKAAIAHIFNSYYVDEDFRKHVDRIHEKLKCCGLDGPTMFKTQIPKSCCRDSNCTLATAYQASCTNELVASYKKIKMILAIVAAITATVAGLLTVFIYFVAKISIRIHIMANRSPYFD